MAQNKVMIEGYGRPVDLDEDAAAKKLTEVCIGGTKDEIKLLAAFLLRVSDRLDDPTFDHAHFCDYLGDSHMRRRFDVIISRRK